MMADDWTLRHRQAVKHKQIGSNEASFPQRVPDNAGWRRPRYIALEAAGETVYLCTSERPGAEGKQIFVAPDTLQEVQDGTPVRFEPVSHLRFRWHLTVSDTGLRLALAGFFVALIGLGIDAAFDLGFLDPESTSQAGLVLTLKSVSWLLQAVGLSLVLWKGILAAK